MKSDFVSDEYKKRHYIAEVEYKNIPGGGVLAIFHNYKTREAFAKPYKTAAAARCQGTRYLQKMGRIYG